MPRPDSVRNPTSPIKQGDSTEVIRFKSYRAHHLHEILRVMTPGSRDRYPLVHFIDGGIDGNAVSSIVDLVIHGWSSYLLRLNNSELHAAVN